MSKTIYIQRRWLPVMCLTLYYALLLLMLQLSKFWSQIWAVADLSSPLQWTLILISDSGELPILLLMSTYTYEFLFSFTSGCLDSINEFSRHDSCCQHTNKASWLVWAIYGSVPCLIKCCSGNNNSHWHKHLRRVKHFRASGKLIPQETKAKCSNHSLQSSSNMRHVTMEDNLLRLWYVC